MKLNIGLKSVKSIQDWSAVDQNTISKSEEYDLIDNISGILNLQAALDTTTAHTGTKFIVQISSSKSGNEDWQDFVEFVGLIGTAATDLIENDPLVAGSTDIALTTHSLTVLGKWLFIEDSTLINSELVMESEQTANEIVVLDETTNDHVKDTAIFNVAMVQNIAIPFATNRVRLIIDNTYDLNGSTLNYKLRLSTVRSV